MIDPKLTDSKVKTIPLYFDYSTVGIVRRYADSRTLRLKPVLQKLPNEDGYEISGSGLMANASLFSF